MFTQAECRAIIVQPPEPASAMSSPVMSVRWTRLRLCPPGRLFSLAECAHAPRPGSTPPRSCAGQRPARRVSVGVTPTDAAVDAAARPATTRIMGATARLARADTGQGQPAETRSPSLGRLVRRGLRALLRGLPEALLEPPRTWGGWSRGGRSRSTSGRTSADPGRASPQDLGAANARSAQQPDSADQRPWSAARQRAFSRVLPSRSP